MNPTPLARLTRPALAVGVVALVAAAVGALISPDAFFQAYLTAYTFWLDLAVGSLAVALLQFVTGGRWGLITRRVCESAAATLPLLALLFVPLVFGLPFLYPWARPVTVAGSYLLQHKAPYLNVPFFVVRAVLYFAAWIGISRLLSRLSAEQDRTGDPAVRGRLQRLSIAGLLVLGFTVSFANIDWLMSLEPDWYSTVYAGMVAMGALLLALAFAVLMVAWLTGRPPMENVSTPRVLNDLGSLLLAFLMLWAYLAYFQYLLIWAGNLSDEISWYLTRVSGGWVWVAGAVAVGGFLVPFWFLLFRNLKRNPRTLAAVAALVVLSRLVDAFWLVRPPFQPGGPELTWLDPVVVLALGGLWLGAFTWQAGRQPLIAPHDPRLVSALEAAREPA